MEIVSFLGITILVFSMPILALLKGKEWLIALVPIYLITGNVFAESFITIFGHFTSLAIPIYAATFLITDILSEHYTKSDARRAVLIGLTGQIIFIIILIIILNAPIRPEKLEAYRTTLSFLPRLITGSFIAYFFSQFWDIYIYHQIMQRTGKNKLIWLRSNASTFSSQFIDTTIFLTIAFYGRPPFQDPKTLFAFILTTWIFKVIVAAIDTPYLYLSRKIVTKKD